MNMTNIQLAKLLNISATDLSRKCGIQRGILMMWTCREILCREYIRLGDEDRNILIEILQFGLIQNTSLRGMIDNIFNAGLYRFPSQILNSYANLYLATNPFNIELRF